MSAWTTDQDGVRCWVTHEDGSRILMEATIDSHGVVDLHNEEFGAALYQVNIADYDGFTFEEVPS